MKFWITRHRRITQDLVVKDIVEGNVFSIYFDRDAAKSAAYPTEKVWAIRIEVGEEPQ